MKSTIFLGLCVSFHMQVLHVSAASISSYIRINYFRRQPWIKGNTAATLTTSSEAQCAIRSLNYEKDRGFRYTQQESNNCNVIGCEGSDDFRSQNDDAVYAVTSDDPTSPIFYFDFEENQCWTNNNGVEFAQESLPFSTANTVVKTDMTSSQYLELGDLSYACITVPESCGAQGGTISVWFKLIDCDSNGGAIVTSHNGAETNFQIACNPSLARYAITETDGYFSLQTAKSTSWVHSVMVYHGYEQGITVYHDGSTIGTDTDKAPSSTIAGSGRVEIGRRVLTSGTYYASTYVDEIKMYNRQLSESEIQNMY